MLLETLLHNLPTLCRAGHDWDKVWASIQQLIVKSVISVQPILKNNYRSAVPLDNDGFSCECQKAHGCAWDCLGWQR